MLGLDQQAEAAEALEQAALLLEEDAQAEADREARPWVVGETAEPGVIERFATHEEAVSWLDDSDDVSGVEAGDYYIDGPSEDGEALPLNEYEVRFPCGTKSKTFTVHEVSPQDALSAAQFRYERNIPTRIYTADWMRADVRFIR